MLPENIFPQLKERKVTILTWRYKIFLNTMMATVQ